MRFPLWHLGLLGIWIYYYFTMIFSQLQEKLLSFSKQYHHNQPMNLNLKWKDSTVVAFDIETSGGYPIGDDIVEFGAVKWKNNQIVERLDFLCKPRKPMSSFITGIHGISNEMVADLQPFSTHLEKVVNFMANSVIVAHHAPFDLGFLNWEFEKAKMTFVDSVLFCSSLLARKLIRETPNHKLQTLVKFLNIEGGTAHRAGADAHACLEVTLECFRRAGNEGTLADLKKIQDKPLEWENFHVSSAKDVNYSDVQILKEAILRENPVRMSYEGGRNRGEFRMAMPLGIVRNPDGDYLYAKCMKDSVNKRFYLAKISSVSICEK